MLESAYYVFLFFGFLGAQLLSIRCMGELEEPITKMKVTIHLTVNRCIFFGIYLSLSYILGKLLGAS